MEVKTKAFHVKVTVSGPIVTGEGLPDQPAATPCTLDRHDEGRHRHRARLLWRIFTPSTISVPCSSWASLRASTLRRPFSIPGRQSPSNCGSHELVGEGMMQWAPDHKHVVAHRDYTVKND